MTASDLQDIVIAALVKRVGGNRRRWRIVLGPVRVLDPATHPHCNWSVDPSGSAAENDAIERLLDDLRIRHPLVTAG